MPSGASYGLLAHMRTVFGVLPFLSSLTILSMSACVGDDTSTPTDAGATADGATTSDGATSTDGSLPTDSSTPADSGGDAPPSACTPLATPATTTLELRGCSEPLATAEIPKNLRAGFPPLEASQPVPLTLTGTPEAEYLFTSGDISFNAIAESAAKIFRAPENYCVSWRGRMEAPTYDKKNYWNPPLFLFGKEDKGLRVLSQFTTVANAGSINPSGVGATFESSGQPVLLQSGFSPEVTVTVFRKAVSVSAWFNGAPKRTATIGAGAASPTDATIRVGGRLPEPSGFAGNASDSNFLGSVRTVIVASPATETECEALHACVAE